MNSRVETIREASVETGPSGRTVRATVWHAPPVRGRTRYNSAFCSQFTADFEEVEDVSRGGPLDPELISRCRPEDGAAVIRVPR